MLTWLLYIGGATIGIGVVGQIYAWVANRPNPVLDICGTVLEGLVDVAGDIDFDGD